MRRILFGCFTFASQTACTHIIRTCSQSETVNLFKEWKVLAYRCKEVRCGMYANIVSCRLRLFAWRVFFYDSHSLYLLVVIPVCKSSAAQNDAAGVCFVYFCKETLSTHVKTHTYTKLFRTYRYLWDLQTQPTLWRKTLCTPYKTCADSDVYVYPCVTYKYTYTHIHMLSGVTYEHVYV